MDDLTNSYIDVLTGHLHKNLNSLFQIEANFILMEKDLVSKNNQISYLQDQLASAKASIEELQNKSAYDVILSEKLKNLQDEYELLNDEKLAYEKKASHIDTFSKQINSLNEELKIRDVRIIELEDKLSDMNIKKKTK